METEPMMVSQPTLHQLWIYPIKSLGGISLTSSRALQKGLALDRRWMLVDENGVFMTQRVLHKMALFKVSLNGSELNVRYGRHHLSFSTLQSGSESMPVKVWESNVAGREVDRDISAWFSEMLGTTCRLVFFPEENPRSVEYPYEKNVSLADAFPILTIGQNSLDDLNSRIPEAPVPMNRFRPNLVVAGELPYKEEEWKNFSIGGVQFFGARKSFRCIVTTINQETAEKGREPLLTLSRYRKEDSKIFFGLNTLVLTEGVIEVGDVISVQQ